MAMAQMPSLLVLMPHIGPSGTSATKCRAASCQLSLEFAWQQVRTAPCPSELICGVSHREASLCIASGGICATSAAAVLSLQG